MATMQDVARRAQVSLSTVSYALSNARPVSAATRARIEQAMRDLGYQPNLVARSLARRRSNTLALTFPTSENALGGTAMGFVAAAADRAREHGYHLVLWPFPAESADEVRDLATQGLADGVILMEVRLEDARVRALSEAGVPFAMIGRTAEHEGLPFVDIDFEATTEQAVATLHALGHRAIGFLNHSESSRLAGYGPTVRAQAGYDAAMRRRGLVPVSTHARENAPGGRTAVTDLFAHEPRMTALVAMNEDATFGAMAELRQRGYDIPTDFSVLSIVSSPGVGEKTIPVLTTMRAPGAELGRLAVDSLLSQLAGTGTAHVPVLIPCEAVPGESVGPAPTPPPH